MRKQPTQQPVLATLREQLGQLEGAHHHRGERISSGCTALDRLCALRRGTLIEYLADAGHGAASVALMAAREACREGGALVIIDRARRFYPPAAARFGLDAHTVLVRPTSQKDYQWALHQSLSSPGVGAVLCWPERLNDRAFRSLQLAAEAGGAVGLLVRPFGVRGQPSWSELQLQIETVPQFELAAQCGLRRLRIQLVRCRHGSAGASVELELDDESATLQEPRRVPVAAPMAAPTAVQGAARA